MPEPPKPLPPKRDVCLALLKEPSVFIHLDPRREGVVVPPWFKRQPQLVLQVGLNMPTPIDDLEVADDGISCTLSFSRSPFTCYLPWEAVYALVGEGGRFMVWPSDVPPEVAAQMQQKIQQSTPFSAEKEAAKPGAKPSARELKEAKAKAKTKKEKPRPRLASVPAPPPSGRVREDVPLAPPPAPSGANAIPQPASPDPTTLAPVIAPVPEAAPAAIEPAPAIAPAVAPAVAEPAAARSADAPSSADDDELPVPARPRPTSRPKRELPPYLRVIK